MSEKYILLVEDNSDDVALTELALKKSQIPNKMIVAWDGEEALDFLFHRGKFLSAESNGKPAVILLDLKLPMVSGLEVLEEIRANRSTSHIPVVVLTSSMEDRDQAESMRLGANRFIRKPTGYLQLVEIIQQIASKWLGWQKGT
jgi:two-component system, response regulator